MITYILSFVKGDTEIFCRCFVRPTNFVPRLDCFPDARDSAPRAPRKPATTNLWFVVCERLTALWFAHSLLCLLSFVGRQSVRWNGILSVMPIIMHYELWIMNWRNGILQCMPTIMNYELWIDETALLMFLHMGVLTTRRKRYRCSADTTRAIRHPHSDSA